MCVAAGHPGWWEGGAAKEGDGGAFGTGCWDALGDFSVVRTFVCVFWTRAATGTRVSAPRVCALRARGCLLVSGNFCVAEVGGEEVESL